MATTITYNSYNLQTSADATKTRLTRDILFRHLPSKNISLKQDSINDGFSITDVTYSQKIITVRGLLISDSVANLRTLRDEFMSGLEPNEKNLDIGYGSGTLRYVASVQSIDCPEEFWNITQIPFEIVFLAQPFGKTTSSTTVDLNSGSNITTTPYNESPSITGTYKCKPTITITVVSETDLTAIKLENTTNLDWVQVARSFAAAEVLVINSEDETIKVDGTSVDFTGVFPRFNPGTNVLRVITTDSSSFAITVSFTYYPTYL